MREKDHVVGVESFDPPVVHVGCAEAAHLPDSEWDHTDAGRLSEW